MPPPARDGLSLTPEERIQYIPLGWSPAGDKPKPPSYKSQMRTLPKPHITEA